MIERLEAIDRQLFLLLNSMHHEWMDPLMYLASNKIFWIPFYLLILFLIQQKYGWKGLGYAAIGIALVILLCDQSSSGFFKPFFKRYRPCNNLDLAGQVRILFGRCGSGYSFISGHATNYFGIAIFSAMLLRDRRIQWMMVIWAAVIAYSRIYLGVHFPADILAGALLGSFFGFLVYRLFERVIPLFSEL